MLVTIGEVAIIGVVVTIVTTVAITGKPTGGLVIPSTDAVIFAVPAPAAVAKPSEDIVATVVLELAQVTWEVMSAVEPSEYVPIASNCWSELIARLDGGFGVTSMENNVTSGIVVVVVEVVEVEDTTVKPTGELVIPFSINVILVLPASIAVASPDEDIVATLGFELLQEATFSVISPARPLE